MIKNVVEMFEFVRYRPQENVKRCLSPQHTALRNAESFKNRLSYFQQPLKRGKYMEEVRLIEMKKTAS